jgi:dimethylamine/trimethylamine dehydrogenase
MECARVLGERGMSSVHLVDSSRAIGGHVRHVSELPGLREWARVIDYRQIQLDKLKNVEVISGRHLTKQTVLEYGADIVIVATGSAWSPVGMNSLTHAPVDDADATTQSHVLTPDQVFAGKQLGKKVVVYDLDGYFMAASLAERFADEDRTVTLVTRFAATAPYTEYTLEQSRLVRRLRESGVGILNNKVITTVSPSFATLVDVWDDSSTALESDSVVLVTQRFPEESLFVDLRDDPAALRRARIGAVYRTGDCAVPGQIADAVFEGHRLAREIDSPHPEHPLPYIRERRLINATESDYTLDSATIAIEG